MKRYGKYGGKVSWIVKRYGKYGRIPYCPYLFTFQLTFRRYFPYLFTIQLTFRPYFPYLLLWNDMGSMEERQVEIGKDMENKEESQVE
jgi:hypothetical protein